MTDHPTSVASDVTAGSTNGHGTVEAIAPAAPAGPVIEILGDATEEQVAALVAVLSAMGGKEPEPEPTRSLWNAPARHLRRSLPHGRGAWRASALPRW